MIPGTSSIGLAGAPAAAAAERAHRGTDAVSATSAPRRPLVVEIIGPAGAGKSSLLRALRVVDPTMRRGRSLDSGALLAIARRAPRWLPIVARLALTTPDLARQYARHLVRIETIDALFPRTTAEGDVVLLDEGPVFSIALMLAFNDRARGYDAVARHLAPSTDRWAPMLDALVWLDADDSILARRIRSREKGHRIKGSSDADTREFLARYRRAYESVTTRLADAGAAPILRVDTSTTPITAIVADVLAMLARLRDAR